jgi:hypothetical protein
MDGNRESESREARAIACVGQPELLDRVIEKLREIDHRSGIARTLAIGELILGQFFGGDAKLWRDRRRNKNSSIRRLADRADCPLSKSALNEAVAVYAASLTLPCVRTFGHIGGSHVASVLHLPPSEWEVVLRRAESDHLSVRELRKRVVSMRREAGETRGRPPSVPNGWSLIRAGAFQVRQGIERMNGTDAVAGAELERLKAIAEELVLLTCERTSPSRASTGQRK